MIHLFLTIPFQVSARFLLAVLLILSYVDAKQLRIAIVGAGPSGCSAAYFLSRDLPDSSITVFERSPYIGGRAYSIQMPIGGKLVTVELGASIVADANTFIRNASRDLGLQTVDTAWTELDPDTSMKSSDPLVGSLGIWDGSKWRYTQGPSKALLGDLLYKVGILLRYGILDGALQASNLVTKMVSGFLATYDGLLKAKSWATTQDFITDAGLSEVVSTTAYTSFRTQNGISELFVREFIGGITRNTYNQEVDIVSAWPAAVSLFSATTELFKVKGGNNRLYRSMLQHSNATTLLNTAVSQITTNSNDTYNLTASDNTTASFDVVILATPIAASGLTLPFSILGAPLTYVKLHVTVILGKIRPSYFKRFDLNQIPYFILTPSDPSTQSLPFNSLSILARYGTTVIVKLFSSRKVQDAVLDALFVSRSSVVRKVWDSPGAYTDLGPRADAGFASFVVQKGIYWTGAMEEVVSAMETQVVAARSVVNAIVKDFN
ncbi:Prenylcysteine lyase-domain-containing protein [Cladochytrium replicatum]|nr:Prenylcysteine lyase-domain-containing protein [Cladochytrium replicatum]